MSYQVMDAVQMRSQYRENEPHNFAPFKIMLALAWHANHDGTIGQAGDARRCVSQRTIAERAGVHYNTVNTWIPQLVDAGELAIEAQGGAGRGCWTVYRVTLPLDNVTSDIEQTFHDVTITGEMSQAKDVTIRLVTLIEELSQRIEELSQRIELMSQGNVTNDFATSGPIVTDPYEIREIREIGGDARAREATADDLPEWFLERELEAPERPEDRELLEHAGLRAYVTRVGHWPGWEAAPLVAARVGETPDEAALYEAGVAWRSKYGGMRWDGILDWYAQRLRAKARTNGSGRHPPDRPVPEHVAVIQVDESGFY